MKRLNGGSGAGARPQPPAPGNAHRLLCAFFKVRIVMSFFAVKYNLVIVFELLCISLHVSALCCCSLQAYKGSVGCLPGILHSKSKEYKMLTDRHDVVPARRFGYIALYKPKIHLGRETCAVRA
jgi:hypothetical protein